VGRVSVTFNFLPKKILNNYLSRSTQSRLSKGSGWVIWYKYVCRDFFCTSYARWPLFKNTHPLPLKRWPGKSVDRVRETRGGQAT